MFSLGGILRLRRWLDSPLARGVLRLAHKQLPAPSTLPGLALFLAPYFEAPDNEAMPEATQPCEREGLSLG